METALRIILGRALPGLPVRFVPFNGKTDLLRRLPGVLRGYASYLPTAGGRLVVVVDRDDDDCHALVASIRAAIEDSGLRVDRENGEGDVLCRVSCEELEAWFFGDIAAVRQVYPRVPDSLGSRAAYRDPDAIAGGTWESLEVVLQQAGYMRGGLRKVALAESVAPHMDLANNTSRSFQVTIAGIRRLVGRAA